MLAVLEEWRGKMSSELTIKGSSDISPAVAGGRSVKSCSEIVSSTAGDTPRMMSSARQLIPCEDGCDRMQCRLMSFAN